jgi:hypothetical protein
MKSPCVVCFRWVPWGVRCLDREGSCNPTNRVGTSVGRGKGWGAVRCQMLHDTTWIGEMWRAMEW